MLKARLELNNSHIDLSADALGDLVSSLSDRKDAADFFEELASYPYAKVREAVAWKSCLTDETVKVVAQDKPAAVFIALINNAALSDRIPTIRIHELVAANDVAMLHAILQNLESMPQLDAGHFHHMFAIHEDAALRLEVAQASDVKLALLQHLARDEDPDVREAASVALQSVEECNASPDTDTEIDPDYDAEQSE